MSTSRGPMDSQGEEEALRRHLVDYFRKIGRGAQFSVEEAARHLGEEVESSEAERAANEEARRRHICERLVWRLVQEGHVTPVTPKATPERHFRVMDPWRR